MSYSSRNNQILTNVSFDICSGDVITIIGPNGAGKSTLGKILIGSIKPDTGQIEKKNNLKIGYMPQKIHINNLVPMTVRDFFLLIPQYKSISQARVSKIVSQTHLEGLLEKQVEHVSVGELQRLLFARILLQDPELLILDEPTQGLDIKGQQDFYALLDSVRAKTTKSILMISHDLHTVMSSSNNVICLNKSICCSGLPESIRHNQNYKNLFTRKEKVLSSYIHNHN